MHVYLDWSGQILVLGVVLEKNLWTIYDYMDESVCKNLRGYTSLTLQWEPMKTAGFKQSFQPGYTARFVSSGCWPRLISTWGHVQHGHSQPNMAMPSCLPYWSSDAQLCRNLELKVQSFQTRVIFLLSKDTISPLLSMGVYNSLPVLPLLTDSKDKHRFIS